MWKSPSEIATTSTVESSDNGNLTFDKLMEAIRQVREIYPTVFYMTSIHVPLESGKVFQIDNDGATPLGYDIICHTSQVEAMKETLAGKFNVMPLDRREQERRLRNFTFDF